MEEGDPNGVLQGVDEGQVHAHGKINSVTPNGTRGVSGNVPAKRTSHESGSRKRRKTDLSTFDKTEDPKVCHKASGESATSSTPEKRLRGVPSRGSARLAQLVRLCVIS